MFSMMFSKLEQIKKFILNWYFPYMLLKMSLGDRVSVVLSETKRDTFTKEEIIRAIRGQYTPNFLKKHPRVVGYAATIEFYLGTIFGLPLDNSDGDNPTILRFERRPDKTYELTTLPLYST
ncbi:hypothetical protein HYX00_01185 [Candidatus Woesearchaeota archaeon]|nr:hypothetical protein [Candidatus Woesearchaeota archaeon]